MFGVIFMKIDESMSFLEGSIKNLLDKKIRVLVNQIPNLEYIVLFGSHARIEQTIESDIDLLAVTSGIPDRCIRGDLCSQFEEDNIDLVFYDLNVFRTSNCLFVSQIKKEGIVIWKKG